MPVREGALDDRGGSHPKIPSPPIERLKSSYLEVLGMNKVTSGEHALHR